MKNEMIENRMAVDSEWEDNENVDWGNTEGYFSRYGNTFVKKECALEVALESLQEDRFYRDTFLEKFADYIESNEEAAEEFLKWYYRDYGEE